MDLSTAAAPQSRALLLLLFLNHGRAQWTIQPIMAVVLRPTHHVTRRSHLEKQDWLEFPAFVCFRIRTQMPSGFTKKTPTDFGDWLMTTDYNHTFTEWSNYRTFGLF
ncbi:hypothetical protein ILYODFUR_036390 [Ilyodon furcidens]|uniref:Secreted protein n=1 Tax=Ilyodon furcidens TaxID=33524 RepID=A0ABV0SS21_9TELE